MAILLNLVKSIQLDALKSIAFENALVTPLLKKRTLDEDVLNNYRLVSNLAFISKVTEKVVASRLNHHLMVNNLQEPFQSAYRMNHSTETAMLRVHNNNNNNNNNGRNGSCFTWRATS